MALLITFLEGVVTFISPCLLPMLPLYLGYFAGSSSTAGQRGATDGQRLRTTFVNALGFICGFTLVFILLGALAGTFGALLAAHRTAFNVICGAIVCIFGLNFAGAIHIPLLDRTLKPTTTVRPEGFFSAMLFGIVFSIGWTPCVGAYLGSALLLASTQGSTLPGVALLLAYSAGLGIPFLISALAIDRLSGAFDAIKRHYREVNIVCGGLLVVIGVLMMTGLLGSLLGMLAI